MVTNKKYQKKTILQAVPALIAGGVERGTLEIAKELVKDGYKSIVVSAGGPMVESLESDGSIHIEMDVATKNPLKIWQNACKMAEVIKKYNVDLIHARSRAPAWSCYLAAKKTGITLITTFHGIYNFKNLFKKSYNSIMTKGKQVIAVSAFVKQHIIEKYHTDPNKITVIHRGVNHEEFSKSRNSKEIIAKFKEKYHVPKTTPVILLPARMTQWKGHLVLIEAIERIKHLNFYCIMAGDLSRHPAYVTRLNELIAKYKIQNRVRIFGNEPNMVALYGVADIVLSTSIEPEAFGRTVIEAQSMEKLVIATNIGGAAETIINGETGFHIPPRDIGALADKIEYCLSILKTDVAKNMTKNARKAVSKQFSLDQMLKSTLEIYNSV